MKQDKMKKKILKFEFFYENHPPTRQYKKKIDFALCNKSITANKLLSINLERFLRRITLHLRVNSANFIGC